MSLDHVDRSAPPIRPSYYADKLPSLRDLFGTQDVALEGNGLRVGSRRYPIVHDVIILSDQAEYTDAVRGQVRRAPETGAATRSGFSSDIQFTFGAEWNAYDRILPEHRRQFADYFDLVDLATLHQRRVCDVGCGNGRWSYFLQDHCRELILVDFSDAIFVARRNLAGSNSCLFFMGDLQALPFRNDFCDFLFCLGVLHHLPTPCLEAVRTLRRYAPTLLIFLYSNFDNRPWYFRTLLKMVTPLRLVLCRITHPRARRLMTKTLLWSVYAPLLGFGALLRPLGLASFVPLHDSYHGNSLARIEQDVYDRFFTPIEQRVSRAEILALRDTFGELHFPGTFPYYHFVCRR